MITKGTYEAVCKLRGEGKTWRTVGQELKAMGLCHGTDTQAADFARNTFRFWQKSHPNGEAKPDASVNIYPETFKAPAADKHIRIGIVSDTHFGSKWAQYTYLTQFYKACKEQGITDIYHCGDVDDGSENMHPGIMYEHHVLGATEHINNICKHYPHVDGIMTHFITGNHDNSLMKAAGLVIGEEIQARRPDMHFLGRDVALVQLAEHCKMELRHPGDGTAYSISYKPQKMVEAYTSDSKPNILCIGHYHKCLYMFERNVHIIMASSFCGTTPFMRSKNIRSALGGWILDIELDDTGTIKTLTPQSIAYYKDIIDDYKSLN